MAHYPRVKLEFLLSDVRADLIGEGIDVAFRAGPIGDSTLVARKLLDSYLALVDLACRRRRNWSAGLSGGVTLSRKLCAGCRRVGESAAGTSRGFDCPTVKLGLCSLSRADPTDSINA